MKAKKVREKSLLFIDDCREYGGVICEIMTSLGFQCEQVCHPDEVLNLIEKPPRPDLIISKFELPQTNAIELYRILLQKSNMNLNLILLSSMPTIATRKMREEKIFFPIFDKLDIDDLCQYVSSNYRES